VPIGIGNVLEVALDFPFDLDDEKAPTTAAADMSTEWAFIQNVLQDVLKTRKKLDEQKFDEKNSKESSAVTVRILEIL
jgi:hypothetical protein